uniref:HTH CENPB-type domain-containing protein n=1 Tax=Clastoptera arizonana TaxID=38151 RepID=A0A1B6C4M0_9HEMI
MASAKRKVLPIKEKVRVIRACEEGRKIADVCREFGLVNSTVGSILKNKNKILKAFQEDGENSKRIRGCGRIDIDAALLKWLRQCRSADIPVNGPLLKEKAEQFGEMFGANFTCSNGWLDRFKARHSISFAKMCGEAKSVDPSVTGNWLKEVWPVVRQPYKDEDIFNADETGLFYKLTPEKTLQFKNEKCVGGKLSKQRVTALVCANMTGSEKRKLLVIGKSVKPRCFKNVKKLPVNYTANKKAWMTSAIFEDELRKWDMELASKNRKILLLVDNCAAHPKLNFTNINLLFFPANCTSVLQPMDQGVIRSLKNHYRKQLLKKIIICMDTVTPVNITVLDGIQFLDNAWSKVTPRTISRCFRKSKLSDPIPDDDEDDVLPLSEWIKKFSVNENGLGVNNLDVYETVDDQIETFQMLSEAEIVDEVQNMEVEENDEDEGEEGEVCPTLEEALKSAETLHRFYCFRDTSASVIDAAQLLHKTTEKMYFLEKVVQKKITDFFRQ